SGADWQQIAIDIIADGTGGAIVAWMDTRPGGPVAIYLQHVLSTGVDPDWPADGLFVAQNVGIPPYPSAQPMLPTDGAGGAIVVWFDHFVVNETQVDRVSAQHVLATGDVDSNWPPGGAALCSNCGPFFVDG